jgi:hypothetical protein
MRSLQKKTGSKPAEGMGVIYANAAYLGKPEIWRFGIILMKATV